MKITIRLYTEAEGLKQPSVHACLCACLFLFTFKSIRKEEKGRKGGDRTNTMISETDNDNPKAEYLRSEANYCPDSPVSSSPEFGQLSRRRDTQTTSGSILPEESGSIQPLVSSAAASPAS